MIRAQSRQSTKAGKGAERIRAHAWLQLALTAWARRYRAFATLRSYAADRVASSGGLTGKRSETMVPLPSRERMRMAPA